MQENKFLVKKDQSEEIIIKSSGKYTVVLSQPGASATIKGAFVAGGKEKIDVEVIIHHTAPNTQADSTFRGVARDSASIRFLGRIIIDENCGNTNSFLTQRVLLLSDQAKAECIPELEIESDSVSCSHAASVSRIPDEHLFYLMSRGIPKEKAEDLIIEGFLNLD